MKQHALSAIFPALPDDELQALAADIKAHGLHSAIVLYRGDVLDGWHRYQACQIAKVNARTIDYNGSDPVAFVKSANWHRRQLTASQRAQAIVALREWRPVGKPNSAPGAELGVSTADLAKEAGVSTRTVEQAKVVESKGTEAQKKAVLDGKVSVKKAVEQITGKKAKPKPEPESEEPDLAQELEIADKEIRSLQALVESLKKTDAAKEIASWRLKFDQLEGRLHQSMQTQAAAEKQATYGTKLLNEIRKALTVQKNNLILPRIAELLKK